MSNPSTQPQPLSVTALEAEMAARRERLAATVDELARKATPKAIAQRQSEAVKARFADATTTPDGDLRVERIAAAVAVTALVVGFLVVRRLRRR